MIIESGGWKWDHLPAHARIMSKSQFTEIISSYNPGLTSGFCRWETRLLIIHLLNRLNKRGCSLTTQRLCNYGVLLHRFFSHELRGEIFEERREINLEKLRRSFYSFFCEINSKTTHTIKMQHSHLDQIKRREKMLSAKSKNDKYWYVAADVLSGFLDSRQMQDWMNKEHSSRWRVRRTSTSVTSVVRYAR